MTDEAEMKRPGWENKLNPNTVLTLLTLVSVLVGMGMSWQDNKAGIKRNAESIERLEQLIGQHSSALATYSNLPYRLTTLEARVGATEVSSRDADRALATILADLRAMRSILERLDENERASVR